ncbi:MAG: hypothetical protein K0R78_1032 [Pelosinus sp.]|nr:hypothetical protein [Pelosinus sp.]
MTNDKATLLKISALFIAIQLVFIFELARSGQPSYARSVMTTTFLWAMYTFLEARYGFYMNTYVRTIVMISLLMDSFFGCYLDLYTKSFTFDKMLHVFGSYSFSLFAYILVVQLLKFPVNRPFKFILIVSLGLSLGGFYEILEFFTDMFSSPTPISQPSLLDTDLDLLGDLIGAIIAALHGTYRFFVNLHF